MFKPKNQIIVLVKQEPHDIFVKKTFIPSSDGKKLMVTMEKPNEKLSRAGWEFDAKDCVRRLKKNYYCEVIRGASHALKIDTTKNEMDFTKFTSDEITDFYKLKIFKSHYAKLLGDLVAALKPYLIVTIIVIIAAIALGAYNAYATNEMSKSVAEILRASSVGIVK